MEKRKEKLIGQIFKLLPLKEESCNTLTENISSIIFELGGLNSLLGNKQEMITIISVLEALKCEENMKMYRSQVFKCTNLVDKVFKSIVEDGDMFD